MRGGRRGWQRFGTRYTSATMQIAFVTLFLGLVLGVQPVELVGGGDVASVELLLDGETVASRTSPPWLIPVDLGDSLVPHRLEAVARDADGAEIARAVQWLNLPRPQAEATVVLEGGEDGRGVTARVAWESVVDREPRKVAVTLDGHPLEVVDPRRIPLPDHDPAQLHLLRVELEFSSNLGAVAEAIFGGGYGNETGSALTAVPVSVEGQQRNLTVEALQGRLRQGEEILRPVAVEEGPAEVVLVMDRQAQPELVALARLWTREGGGGLPSGPSSPTQALDPLAGAGGSGSSSARLRETLLLGEGQILRFLWPFAQTGGQGDVRYTLFARSEDHPPSHGGVLWLLTAAQQPAFALDEQRLADAVAVAGMTAAGRSRRRAVILVLSEDPQDASRFDPRVVRSYLSHLRVPLFVWSVKEPSPEVMAAWGEVRSLRRQSWFRAAVEEVSTALERQRIVWIEGLRLPQEVTLSGPDRDVRLVQ